MGGSIAPTLLHVVNRFGGLAHRIAAGGNTIFFFPNHWLRQRAQP
jgi:hypothetical protein